MGDQRTADAMGMGSIQQSSMQYLDEAVVEEEAEKGGAHPAVAVIDDTRHDGAHCGLQRRAAGVVERRRELAVRRRREENQCKEHAMAGRRGRSHGRHLS